MKLERMVITYAKTINVASVQHCCNQILHIADYDYDDIFLCLSDGSSCIFLVVSLILISFSHQCVSPKWECSQCRGYGTLQPLNIQGTVGVNKCIYFIFLLAINIAFAYLLRNWLKEKQACELLQAAVSIKLRTFLSVYANKKCIQHKDDHHHLRCKNSL